MVCANIVVNAVVLLYAPQGLGGAACRRPTWVAQALDRIDKWLKQSGMTESRLGLLSCANARAVERVRSGSGSVATLQAILDYIDQHPAKGSRR